MSTPGDDRDFDARAATWDDDPTKLVRARVVAQAIEHAIPLDGTGRALEYGCGTGLLSFLLRERFADMTLADVSPGMLAVAAGKIAAAGDAHMRVLQLDLLVDAMPAASFDVILSMMTLHHIPDTDAILKRFHDVLASPGYLCIADLDREDGSFHGAGFTGHHGFDRGALARSAQAAGFDTVTFTTAHRMTKQVGESMRTFPIFLMVAAKA